MSSVILSKIEKLIRLLKHIDSNVRYTALKKLASVLSNVEYAGYHNIILDALKKYSLRDPNDRIRHRARDVINININKQDVVVKKKIGTMIRVFSLFSCVVFLALFAALIFIDESEPEKKKLNVQNKKKQEIDVKIKLEKGERDSVNITIDNLVKLKDRTLFNNKMNFTLEREVVKILKSGNFVMKQWITRGAGIMGNLYEFGYPNPGDKLYLVITPLGDVTKIVTVDDKKRRELSQITVDKFSRYKFPRDKMVSGEGWDLAYGGQFTSKFVFDGLTYLKNRKFIKIVYDKIPSESFSRMMKSENSYFGAIYLDSVSKLPLHSVRKIVFKKNGKDSVKDSFRLSSNITITEISSKLDDLKLEGQIGNILETGILNNKEIAPEGLFKGVTE